MSVRYFLATTALEEFWDTTRPMLFLGEWCRRFQRRHVWEPLGAEVCPSVWQDPTQAHVGYQVAMAAYEHLLPIVAAELNRFHQVNHGLRYWRIVIGPWLLHYTHILYDRYTSLKAALSHAGEVDTLVLDESCFVTPRDTLDLAQRAGTDLYNLQLYSRILQALGRDFPTKRMVVDPPALPGQSKPGLKARLLELLTGGSRARAPIVLYNSYFSTWHGLRIQVRSGFRVQAIDRQYQAEAHAPDAEKRRNFRPSNEGGDAFMDLVLRLLPMDVPTCFIEGFQALGERGAPEQHGVPRVILAANPWYYDETFKRWAAECQERGARLGGIQHGGNYGSLQNLYSLDHETAIVDDYFTWGWSGEDPRYIPFYAPKLVASGEPAQGRPANSGILLGLTSMPRYLVTFPFTPDAYSQYLRWLQRFYAGLRHKTDLRIRRHFEDFGWDLAARFQEDCPDAMSDSWQVTFRDSLRNCRLYVCDHLSTTFIEALAMDKPTVLFWDPEANALTSEAQPYYDQLRQVGILHDSPEAAAAMVDRVYEDVEAWWGAAARQAAVREFLHHFGRTSPDALDQWVRKLKGMATQENQVHGAV
ncbi:MAG TPA: LIC12162 family protein [Stenomitos sp.]